MLERPFRKWIEASYSTYDSDSWFFLRELAQNSRDAGARSIWVTIEKNSDEEETLMFLDDGTGMTFPHAQKFLFRLYASSKMDEKYSAGMYGIGFWTIFRYKPQTITIESRYKKEAWAVSLDSELNVNKTPCQLTQSGTRIKLSRKSHFQNQNDFKEAVESGLSRYCRFLRRNDQKASTLVVYFQGKMITRPFNLPGVITKKFHKGPVEGIVGLNHLPKVTLLARGLPVWEGATLEELSHIPRETVKFSEIGPGLAPVFLLNGNNLDVNMSRRTVMENKALARVTKIAKNELSSLVHIHAHQVYPKYRFLYLWDSVKKFIRKFSRLFRIKFFLLLFILVPLEIFLLNTFIFKPAMINDKVFLKTNPLLQVEKNTYEGAIVSSFNEPIILQMSYQPEINHWFKIFSAEQYDMKKGFIRDRDQDYFSTYAGNRCGQKRIFVKIQVKKGGSIILPYPTGYKIEINSITYNSTIHPKSRTNLSDETIIEIDKKGGLISYYCCPRQDNKINSQEKARLTQLPANLKIPRALSREINNSADKSIENKIQKAVDLTQTLLSYDISDQTARHYQSLSDYDWLQKIIRIGKGDCDILNGTTTLFLRKMNIPSRLVIGLIGKRGRILPSLHAWVEYYHQGWKSIDSSQLISPLLESSLQQYSTHLQQNQNSTRHPDREISEPYSDEVKTSGSSARLFIYFLISLAFFLIPIFFLLLKKKVQILPAEKMEQIKKNLSQMAMGALLQPGAWGYESNIWHYHIIPVIGKKPLSLQQAKKLTQKNKLFTGNRGNPLVQQFVKAGISVLDQEDKAFTPLLALLPGVVDLNMIHSLKARLPETVKENPLAKLLVMVNKKLKKISNDLPLCLWSPNLTGQDNLRIKFFNFSTLRFIRTKLTLKDIIPKKEKIPLPDHFMVFNPESTKFQNFSQVYQKNPSLALFRIIKTIIEELKLIPDQEKRLIKRASKLLLKETR